MKTTKQVILVLAGLLLAVSVPGVWAQDPFDSATAEDDEVYDEEAERRAHFPVSDNPNMPDVQPEAVASRPAWDDNWDRGDVWMPMLPANHSPQNNDPEPTPTPRQLRGRDVCGTDERGVISDTTLYTNSAIVHIVSTFPSGKVSGGTGFVMGPGSIATAGHVIFDHAEGGWATNVKVHPGRDKTLFPFGTLEVNTGDGVLRSVTGWTVDAKVKYDYGALVFTNSGLEATTGSFGFKNYHADSDLKGTFCWSKGYPGDKTTGEMWRDGGDIKKVFAKRLRYDIDTFGGQSGMPIYEKTNSGSFAVAIHSHGNCPNNIGVRINDEVFGNLVAWCNSSS